MSLTSRVENGVALLVIDRPPVNALDIAGWSELADTVLALGRKPEVHVLVLAAEGKGFCAGVDIKELAAAGQPGMVDVNRACHAAFGAVYDCEVPVIAAVQGHCLGGGVGLAGNADVVIAADDATFGLPEVDRGALGAATHLARLVPQHRLRAMYYTSATASAEELRQYGSVLEVVPRSELRAAALRLADVIAAKDPLVMRRAKEAMNGIEPLDVHRSYRYEQGFTFELSLSGAAAAAQQEFVQKRTK
ncbi:MAG: enoyl-CoA hydratase family protein [Chloroflexota bacterium]|nr:enoyl-CoA hydratase family protein [Chloroflexota bacterium]